jgi:hypothetical protein
MTQLSPTTTNTETLKTTKSSAANSSTPATISTDVSPWIQPELEKSPDHTLELLRETKHMINSLQDREKRLKGDIEKLYQDGSLAALVDEENSQKYNGPGVSVMLVPGKSKKQWSPEVQSEIDKLQRQILKLEYEAERKHMYTETKGQDYWRVNLTKDQ